MLRFVRRRPLADIRNAAETTEEGAASSLRERDHPTWWKGPRSDREPHPPGDPACGSKLSGGERQRVAIARALLRRPRLLLLDEATSQLDAVNELALRDVIAETARETTVLVVAHRLSTVTDAHRIVVMDAGTIRAIGTHRELVDGDELYAQLAATQLLVPAERPAV